MDPVRAAVRVSASAPEAVAIASLLAATNDTASNGTRAPAATVLPVQTASPTGITSSDVVPHPLLRPTSWPSA